MSRNSIYTSLLITAVVTLLVVLAFLVKTGANSNGCCGANKGACGSTVSTWGKGA